MYQLLRKGSHLRYVMVSWCWALLWPSYGCVFVWCVANHGWWDQIVGPAINLAFIGYRHTLLVREDDDNCWRRMGKWLMKRIRSIRLPQIHVPRSEAA